MRPIDPISAFCRRWPYINKKSLIAGSIVVLAQAPSLGAEGDFMLAVYRQGRWRRRLSFSKKPLRGPELGAPSRLGAGPRAKRALAEPTFAKRAKPARPLMAFAIGLWQILWRLGRAFCRALIEPPRLRRSIDPRLPQQERWEFAPREAEWHSRIRGRSDPW
jgi:hypothetical protein